MSQEAKKQAKRLAAKYLASRPTTPGDLRYKTSELTTQIGLAYNAAISLKGAMDTMDEIPASLKVIYRRTVSVMDLLAKAKAEAYQSEMEFRRLRMASTPKRLTVGRASAKLVHTWKGGSNMNESMTWEVQAPGVEPHFVTSSRIWNPPETLVFETDANGRGSSGREVAGGPEIGHQEAMEDYLNIVNMRSRKRQAASKKYTPAQLAIWKSKHRDFRSGSIQAGDAKVLVNGGARGTMLVPLESL
jgi:hypothetical protein